MNEIRTKIEDLLRSTERAGVEFMITYLGESGFYEAPCSAQYHLACEGGLAQHSLNVFEVMEQMWSVFKPVVTLESVIITSLLHDVGKVGQFDKPGYVENILKSGKRSDKKPYMVNSDLLNVPHEIRSLSIIDNRMNLTEEEYFAILYHNGLYGPLKYEITGKERPLYLLLHFADMWASRVIEANAGEDEE